jgi:hypothetical protein
MRASGAGNGNSAAEPQDGNITLTAAVTLATKAKFLAFNIVVSPMIMT